MQKTLKNNSTLIPDSIARANHSNLFMSRFLIFPMYVQGLAGCTYMSFYQNRKRRVYSLFSNSSISCHLSRISFCVSTLVALFSAISASHSKWTNIVLWPISSREYFTCKFSLLWNCCNEYLLHFSSCISYVSKLRIQNARSKNVLLD